MNRLACTAVHCEVTIEPKAISSFSHPRRRLIWQGILGKLLIDKGWSFEQRARRNYLQIQSKEAGNSSTEASLFTLYMERVHFTYESRGTREFFSKKDGCAYLIIEKVIMMIRYRLVTIPRKKF